LNIQGRIVTLWLIIAIVLVVVVAAGAIWIFRQRTPDEIRAARERLRQLKGKP